MITPERQEEINRLLDTTASRFAKDRCKTCGGKGYYLHNPVGTITKTPRVGRKKGRVQVYKSLCSCATSGYKRTASALLAMPCTHCGEVGSHCEHRPRELMQYMDVCRERWTKIHKE